MAMCPAGYQYSIGLSVDQRLPISGFLITAQASAVWSDSRALGYPEWTRPALGQSMAETW